MYKGSQNGPDILWMATELSAIRSGIDGLTKVTATMQERVLGIRDEMGRVDTRLTDVERDISALKTKNVTKESSWLGVWKIAAIVPVIAAFMAIINFVVQLGLIEIAGK